jgi:hypothetical protein
VIDSIVPSSPAEKANMVASDANNTYYITHIDGIPVDNLTDEQFKDLCVGPRSFESVLLVKHLSKDGLKHDIFYVIMR